MGASFFACATTTFCALVTMSVAFCSSAIVGAGGAEAFFRATAVTFVAAVVRVGGADDVVVTFIGRRPAPTLTFGFVGMGTAAET